MAEAVGLRESTLVRLVVRGDRIIIEPVLDPFELALRR
ncbi:MAG: AbrB/MazE/SpoVT family DNA-binding domain-containing protein, partial [Desulfurococcales archaeon]|nr:AbrB/MazE/SpoVT family DNA-binding domain-containing protein [Desulfurococcales archaeon]